MLKVFGIEAEIRTEFFSYLLNAKWELQDGFPALANYSQV